MLSNAAPHDARRVRRHQSALRVILHCKRLRRSAPEPFFEKFCLQMLPASHIIIAAPAGVMELVDVADSKASKSGSMKSDKNLDFSRLPSYNKIWLL